jgi:choline dehydrogenase
MPWTSTLGRAGRGGWGYADVLPYFKRMEDWHDGGHGGDPAWRGQGGRCMSPAARATTRSSRPLSRPGGRRATRVTDDYNGEKQEGLRPLRHDRLEGRALVGRQGLSAPALRRPIAPGPGAGPARGDRRGAPRVEVDRGGRDGGDPRARRGDPGRLAINSPKLLMLSGDRPGGASGRARHRRASRTGPAWARTCRITWSSTSRSPRPSRSRSTNTGTFWGKAWVGAQWLLHAHRPGRVEPVRKRGLHPLGAGVPIPTSSIISCPSPCAMTGRWPRRGMASRPMWARCAPLARGGHAARPRPGGGAAGSCSTT